jgi:hypothetical protein
MKTDTPETDAETARMAFAGEEKVTSDFARKLERERDEARSQLYRICKQGFDNQDTIGLEPADDYVLRKLAELREALSGRTVSCSQCNELARTIEGMREAMKDAQSAISAFLGFHSDKLTLPQMRSLADTMSKLKPFLK